MPDPLLILAMDHRDSLERDVYGISGDPTPDEAQRLREGKEIVFEGVRAAIDGGIDRSVVGILVDERFGAPVARATREAGIDLAMPIERSGQKLFTLEYGTLADDEWLDHVAAFNPAQVKVLVHDNPDADPAGREAQLRDLALVSRRLAGVGRPLLIELLVGATDDQLASVGGDALAYDRDIRPGLTVTCITDMQRAGIEPTWWKIEGLETTDAAESIVRAARADGRDSVSCIVLGRDAPAERLDHWLTIAAGVEGFTGFAIGRSIWQEPLEDLLAGKATDGDTMAEIARRYTHFANLFLTERAAHRP
jgi:myo-inositol catabolism protein IolC